MILSSLLIGMISAAFVYMIVALFKRESDVFWLNFGIAMISIVLLGLTFTHG